MKGRRDIDRRYDDTEKGKARYLRYNKSPKGRERTRTFDSSPKGKVMHHDYQASPKGRATKRLYLKRKRKLSDGTAKEDRHR